MRRFLRSQQKSESGQAAVLACLCAFTMVVFVMLTTNVGMLVSDRIRMQNVADATAYAGALEQARILNKIRLYNRSMLRRAAAIRGVLTMDNRIPPFGIIPVRLWPKSGCKYSSDIPEAILDAYEQLTQLTYARMSLTLRRGQNSSTRAAQFTAEKNMTGMGFGRSFESYRVYPESPNFFGKSLLEPPAVAKATDPNSVSSELDVAMLEFSYAYYRGCPCKKKCCFFPLRSSCVKTKTRTIPTWWWKKDRNSTVFFPIRLRGTPLRRFLDIRDIRGYFGTSVKKPNNRISVYSVAKPYDGMVGVPDIGTWSDELHGTDSIRVLASIRKSLHTMDGLEDLYQIFYEQNDTRYRARLAGVHERLGNDHPSSELLPQYNGLEGAPPDIASVEQLFTHPLDRRNLSSDEYEKMLH